MNETVELDVPGEPATPRDESLILDAAHAPADVWSHAPTISRQPRRPGGGPDKVWAASSAGRAPA